MMRSPNKDYFMDIEESTSSKDGLWDYSGNAFVTNESNTDSAFPMNEMSLHGMEMDQDLASNPEEESVTLNDAAETLSKSPCKKQTARKSVGRGSSSTPNIEEQNAEIKLEPNLDDDAANIAAKVLHFFCQKCKNGIRYSPNDLQKHFLICHNGELPLYPCEMCNFSANDFQEFKQHRKTHRSALVKCEICNNDYLYTLLGLTKHFTVMHCVNGHFSCSKCRFSTRDVGTFVQHIHRHNGIEYACQKCNHISYSKPEFQRHLQGHTTMFPFSCQYCNYSAMRKDFIVKHILAKHREHVHRDEHILDNSNPQMAQANAGQKPVLKKHQTEVQEKTWWKQDGNPLGKEKVGEGFERSSGLPFRTPEKEQALKDYLLTVNSEQPSNGGLSSVTTINCNKEDLNTQGGLGLLQNAVHGPTVLMVKNNKITVPANYTATFVGYKMVNGKQNLVIKLLPSNKQSTSTSQPSPQSSNSLPRFSQNTNHGSYGPTNNLIDNRLTPSFKPPFVQSATTGTPVEKQSTPLQGMTTSLGSLITRKNESVSRLGTINRSPSFEAPPKTMHNFNAPSSSVSDTGRKIKEEPQDYNINEHQFFDTDHKSESGKDRTHTSTASSRLTVDPTTGFLYRPRHNSESSGLPSTGNMYNKDLNSSLLHSSTASGLGNYAYSSFPPKFDFGMRGIQPNDRFPRPMELNRNDNAPFMPRITSVFSLQSRMPDPKPFGKNTYLHNILQDNRRVNDKVCIPKTSSPLVTSSTLAFAKQSMSSPVPRFENRIPNGNIPSAVFMKQDPDGVGSGVKTLPARVNELLKAHSDSIVSQQLARDRIGTVAKPTGLMSFQQLRAPQINAMPQNHTVYQSGVNRFPVSGVTNSYPGLRMASSQPNSHSTATFSTRLNAPVMLNTKPGMVLTISNGPFGTIRNVTNGSSQVPSTVSTLGKMSLPRLQRPPVPHILKTDFGASPNNFPAGILSGSVGSKLPINLNVLQCSMNSDHLRAKTGSTEMNKQPQHMQKQSLYALLPDGKQAVLLNYVPNLTAQKPIPINQVSRKLLPKKPDEVQQATLLKSGNQANTIPAASVKEEDTSALEGYGGNVPKSTVTSAVCLKSNPAELKTPVRSTSRASSEEYFSNESSNKTVSHATASTSKLPKQKSKLSNMSTSSKSKSCKRKFSDSSSYEADYEFKTKRRVCDFLQDVPRKQMLHRKCKAKSYSSEVESLPEIPSRSPTPSPTQSPVPTPSPSPPPTPSSDVVRSLTLYPFSDDQLIKYPRRDQPVVVLNHPDVDVPEIINVMKTISKFSGHILKVTLSKKTLDALLESGLLNSNGRRRRRSKPVSPVKERFVLKLTLKKTSKNNYKIVKNTPTDKLQSKFSCWFCGRIFDNQDEWVGHGQRHLMEATKDWNTLF
ncbi:zinc finger protein 518A [Hyperolius riggenbachi]|uniref:zinc finger protein 518A n=1 Tax=Hyperolius riggenbachi TaxID=752182 RepID=UPI0035A2E631